MNLNIAICNSSDIPIYRQVSDEIKSQILSKEIRAKEALPSIHMLARYLHISVSTTKQAYEELEKEQLIYTTEDEVSFVTDHQNERIREEGLSSIRTKLKLICSLSKTYNISLDELTSILESYYNHPEL